MAKLIFQRQNDILSAVRKRSKEISAKMTPKDFFTGKQFIQYANSLVAVMLKQRRKFRTQFVHDPNQPFVAYTDGEMLCLNTANSIVSKIDDLQTSFSVNLGIIFHEVGHKLFLDFAGENRAMDKIKSGSIYGSEPKLTDNHAIANWEEIKKTITEPQYAQIVARLYHELSNIISDGHDELAMKNAYKGYVAYCIETAGNAQYEQSCSLEELSDNAKYPRFRVYFDLILCYAKFGRFKYENVTPGVQEYLDGMDQILPFVDNALTAETTRVKFTNLSYIMVFLWDSIRELLQTQQGSSSSQGSGSGSGNGSDSGNGSGSDSGSDNSTNPFNGMTAADVSNVLEQAIQQAKGDKTAPIPKNCNHKAIDSGNSGVGGASDSAVSDDMVSAMQQKVVNDTAYDQAQSEVQNGLDKELRDYLRSVDIPAEYNHVPVRIKRHHGSGTDMTAYNSILQEVAPLAKSMATKMKELLRQINEKCDQRHKIYGRKLVAGDTYRKDGKFFSQRKLPSDLPNMSICVLCDESGSMGSDSRYIAAQKAMVLLERFASEMNIPCMMAGHNYKHGNVVLDIYSDYASAMQAMDRTGLANIYPSGCNHDGIPLRLCGQLLADRPEQVKLLFVISDGSPNGSGNYQGVQAIKDLQDAVKKLNRKGVTVYGCAIGDDEEAIKEIYGKGFLNLTNLSMMPKTLLRLVKQKIV